MKTIENKENQLKNQYETEMERVKKEKEKLKEMVEDD